MIKHGNFMEYLYHRCYVFPKMSEYSTTFIVSNLWIWLDHDERIISRLLHFKGVIWIIGEVVSSTPTNFFFRKGNPQNDIIYRDFKKYSGDDGSRWLTFFYFVLWINIWTRNWWIDTLDLTETVCDLAVTTQTSPSTPTTILRLSELLLSSSSESILGDQTAIGAATARSPLQTITSLLPSCEIWTTLLLFLHFSTYTGI